MATLSRTVPLGPEYVLISPAEPSRVKQELAHATSTTVSILPEQYGADFLTTTPIGLVGVQRKTVDDLVVSLRDGRLAKEIAQAKRLALFVLLIEGRIQWTNESLLLSNATLTVAQYLGLMWSLQSSGSWVAVVETLSDSIVYVSKLEKWLRKQSHHSIRTRPNPERNEFGVRDNRDWARWVLQSFEGIGAVQAEAIIDHFGGLPLSWNVSEEQLREVKGIGPKRAAGLVRALSPSNSS